MNTILFSLPINSQFAKMLSEKLNVEMGFFEMRQFPDGETYLRINSEVKNKKIVLICDLSYPNNKILPLYFMAQTLKQLGAKKICLLSPYLPYMRQDKQFNPGESVTAILFAKFIADFIDSLITIDPHLHRITDLGEIYPIPTITLHATLPIAKWIINNVDSPLIIGPDEESTQWVIAIAQHVNAPYIILKKNRHGDKKVTMTVPEISDNNKTPVLVDDIISTGTTMHAVIQQLAQKTLKKPICIGVHALFNQEVYESIIQAGAQEVISCNTIPHPSNKIDITDILLEGIIKC